ncbi:TrmB family transcriptional regulator [Halorussus sp. AFM4]|uniref:TrmB family transcriptional regulator n=1 Tax=Halorussus sp. AFM4 TaxID=3421651 RepID=UPI003EBA2C41
MDDEEVAANALEQLGLTEYEARCFVALTRIPHGTAKEVAKVADVPRSRVYETMDRLQDRGLVEVQQGEPRTFQAVSIDTAVRILRKEYESHVDTVERTLRRMEPVYKESQQAVWAISDHEQVTERVLDLVTDAADELVLIALDEELVSERVLTAVSEAEDRGVSVHLGTDDETVREAFADRDLGEAVFTTSLVEWFGSRDEPPRIGRLLMVDRGPVLASAVHDGGLPGVPNETAAWSDGVDHGFATFAERVLSYELLEHVTDGSVSVEDVADSSDDGE